ncbi:nuclear receptor coactivator 5 isoform X2 [Bombina bombina]|nr:nuclear receptor coactivator 5 isoform X2 [Bombina bombina]
MNKAPSRSSPTRRDVYAYGETRSERRDRSPIRTSPRRDRDSRDDRASRTLRDSRNGRDGREPRDSRDLRDTRDLRDPKDSRDLRDAREPRDFRDARDSRDSRDLRDPRDLRDSRDARSLRDPRDARDLRDPLYDRYRDVRDPLYRRDESLDKYRPDDLYHKRDDPYVDRYRDSLDRHGREAEDRLKREDRRREELYRKYYDEIQRRFDAERPVECSVVVVNKQSKEYAEVVGRKVRDLGMMVDLIFLNTEVSLTQALEDITRGGTPFAIVVTQQHQVHCSCTVNILFGTPQEHRNMPIADAMILVARNFERFKTETRDKERETIARQAAKMASEAIMRERAPPVDEGIRGLHPPTIQAILGLLADNRYVTADEIDKIIIYLHDRKERLLRGSSEPLPPQLSRPPMGVAPGPPLETPSISSNPPLSMTQPMAPAQSAPQPMNNPQQELQAKILSLFNSGAGAGTNTNAPSGASAALGASSQSFGNVPNTQQRPVPVNPLGQTPQRSQVPMGQHPDPMGQGVPGRNVAPRQGGPPQATTMYGQMQARAPVPSNIPNQRAPGSAGINFDNPSVQKALDTLIQSGPALSHLVNQTSGHAGRGGPLPPHSAMGPYQRHY